MSIERLECEFYSLQSEVYNIKTITDRIERNIGDLDDYCYNPIKNEINELRSAISANLERISNLEFELNKSNFQQATNLYYLENKEKYDKFFYSDDELSGFLAEKFGSEYDTKFWFVDYSNQYRFSIAKTTLDYKFFDLKDFLIRIPNLNDICYDYYNNPYGVAYKYCVNEKELINFLKKKFFDKIMTAN